MTIFFGAAIESAAKTSVKEATKQMNTTKYLFFIICPPHG
jgi:hypothetical protein